jgi:hypothetical protein
MHACVHVQVGRLQDSPSVSAVSVGADKKANTQGRGALELLEHVVLLDAARDNDGGGNAEPLFGEIDLLSRLSTLELIDLKHVTIDTAKGKIAVDLSAD